jgi:parallel beta-helix repeat protein
VTIRNVAISGFTRGIVSDGQLHISDSAIEDNVRSGIFITGGSAFITDNRITGNGASGIYAADDTDASIGGNTIAGNGDFALALARNAYAVAGANSMYDNGRFAVDVGIDGPTPLFAPAITSARYDEETGDTIVALSASYTDTLYLFASPSLNRAGFAEAKEPVWSGGSRVVRVHRDLRRQYVTALGQRQVIRYGDSFAYVTSELSPGVQVK